MKTNPIMLIFACIVACGCSRDQSKTNTMAQSGTQTAARDASPSGAADCNDYFRLVSRCIETKMPESERAEQRQNLENDRKMIESIGWAIAGQSCTENIRKAIQNDSHGCYAEEAAKRGIPTACTLMTRAELEQILQVALKDGIHDGDSCRYPPPANTTAETFKITVHWKDGRDDMDAARGALAGVNPRGRTESRMSEFVSGSTVEGLGDDAFFTLAGSEPMLSVRFGDVAISLVGATREQLIEIAQKMHPRIEPNAKPDTVKAFLR
jgi:hypothetical protein